MLLTNNVQAWRLSKQARRPMELREWLIILGLALVTIIVIDGVRRLQRQRKVPRLDRVDKASADPDGEEPVDPEQAAREAEVNWELPNGGARVVKPAEYDVKPKPKIKRQDHPGPSRVLSEWRQQYSESSEAPFSQTRRPSADAVRDTQSASQPESANRAPGSEHVERADDNVSQSDSRAEAATKATHDDPVAKDALAKEEGIGADGESRVETPHYRDQAQPEHARSAEPTDDERREPTLTSVSSDESKPPENADMPLAADPGDHDEYHDAERYRLVDVEGMADSLKSKSLKVGSSMQRFGASLQKGLSERKEQRKKQKLEKAQVKAEEQARKNSRRQQAQAEQETREKEARLAAERERHERESIEAQDYDDPLFVPRRPRADEEARMASRDDGGRDDEPAMARGDDEHVGEGSSRVATHPSFERVLRNDVKADHARETLVNAEEVIVISVMSHEEEGFSGAALLDLMLACGLRYSSDMGVFHRFETEDPNSELQFSMVNVVKPGTFPLQSMDDFRTPGVTLLMPLPCASDTLSSFEAMVETAMVVVRHLGGELKDENHSVMTAQTVEFARQRVQEFERRYRLHRYQAT
ncbi:cell division protein ZipA [Aidingimonas halophila]|uniref:Cell division protein ZipA n=1 Tax=Aidingimonas halophila TaxID=574349 RepID=A0A1H2V928_9GAMM|nr:cell division protein ZipA [Aidingimonas halophila]GHC23913.1 hypothetical protein GCM10008094_13500 [Aidingimonas halophila]SDW64369.1 cell division protein ZipA [Aidingimonas halophila]